MRRRRRRRRWRSKGGGSGQALWQLRQLCGMDSDRLRSSWRLPTQCMPALLYQPGLLRRAVSAMVPRAGAPALVPCRGVARVPGPDYKTADEAIL